MNDIQQNEVEKAQSFSIPSSPHHFPIGPIIGVLLIMVVLSISGLYIWGSMLSKEGTIPGEPTIVNNEPETPRAIVDTQILETLSPSDDLDAIEADITSTNLDSLDTDLTTIDTELDAVLPQ